MDPYPYYHLKNASELKKTATNLKPKLCYLLNMLLKRHYGVFYY